MATVSRVREEPRCVEEKRCGVTRHRLSVNDYEKMIEVGILQADARVELIDGGIIDMSPISAAHAALVNVLVRHVSQHLSETSLVSCQNPLRLDNESEPEPDLVLLKPRSDCYCEAHPGPADTLLIIEVADASLSYDLGVKVPLYARAGVPEVWVVEAATRRTDIFRRAEQGGAAPAAYADVLIVGPDEPLPFAVFGESMSTVTVNVSLAQLLPQVM